MTNHDMVVYATLAAFFAPAYLSFATLYWGEKFLGLRAASIVAFGLMGLTFAQFGLWVYLREYRGMSPADFVLRVWEMLS